MKIYLAGGEGLTAKRQKSLFTAGCRHRLTSFFSGNSMQRVLDAKESFESDIKYQENNATEKG